MIIPYKKKRKLRDIILALLWGFYAFLGFTKATPNTFHYLALIGAVFYVLSFIFDSDTYYFKINNGILSTKTIFKTTFPLTDIKTILVQDTNYILKTKDKTLQIDTTLIDATTLNIFTSELKQLDATWS